MSDKLVDVADSLDAMRDAVVEAASFTASLWMSYLLVFFYLLIAIAGVTQQDLFLEDPVQLPFLNVSVPLRGFFFLGPGVFVIIHMYVLLHFSMLASKVGSFNEKLRETTAEPLRTVIRRELPNNVFVHFLAGPRELRRGLFGFLLRSISWVSLVLGPIFLLMFFQLQFLCFHNEIIINVQRFFIATDFFLLWRLWPGALHGEIEGEGRDAKTRRKQSRYDIDGLDGRSIWDRLAKPTTYVFLGGISVFSAFIIFMVATFPGEWFHRDAKLQPIKWARARLVDGQLNPASGKLSSYWTDSLVLPNFDPIDHSKFGSESQFDDVQSTYAIRGRDLSFAIFTNDDFQKFDFTGSNLTDAKFNDADLREAQFVCTKNESVLLNEFSGNFGGVQNPKAGSVNQHPANNSNNPLDVPQHCTTLTSAVFLNAELRGADFTGAMLQNASFEFANLRAVVFDNANLSDAKLDYAALQDASFLGATLTNATLTYSKLQGARLDFANLTGAKLGSAELQGASLKYTRLNHATLNAAMLDDAVLTSTPLQDAILDNARFEDTQLADMDLTSASLSLTDFGDASFSNVKPAELQSRLERRFMDAPETPQQYQAQIVGIWEQIGCDSLGAPYVIRSIILRMPILFGADAPDQGILGREFTKKSCEGNQGLSDLEKSELQALGAANKTN